MGFTLTTEAFGISAGDDGVHDNHGFHGDGGENNFGQGVRHGGGAGRGHSS